jgi:parallel beta-helix repeat protein
MKFVRMKFVRVVPGGWRRIALLVGFVFGAAVARSVSFGDAYYVAKAGRDSNPGTKAQPFATLNKGAAVLKPGDTLFIRGGTYYQTAYAPASGTAKAPVVISGYPGENVVIDGVYTNPVSSWGSLFSVAGSYVQVKNVTIKRSNWMGLTLRGAYDQAIAVNSVSNMENGILLTGNAEHGLVDGCNVYYNAKSNEEFRQTRNGWSSGLSAARGAVNSTLRNNTVWNNWGEGLSTYETTYTVMQGNKVYNNILNVYLSDVKFATLTGNLVYSTPRNPCANVSQIGIGIGDETYHPASSDNRIVNNLLLGNAKNIYYWSGNSGGGLVNVVIAYNTLVNSSVETNLKLGTGKHSNSVIANNIFVQDGSLQEAVVADTRGITFSHNLWSRSPVAAVQGDGDVIANPGLVRAGKIAPGKLNPNWFTITGSSPAVGKAGSLAHEVSDFFGIARGNRADIGAIQHRTPGTQSN